MVVPVEDQDHQPLMLITPTRARRWIKNGKARLLERWSVLRAVQHRAIDASVGGTLIR